MFTNLLSLEMRCGSASRWHVWHKSLVEIILSKQPWGPQRKCLFFQTNFNVLIKVLQAFVIGSRVCTVSSATIPFTVDVRYTANTLCGKWFCIYIALFLSWWQSSKLFTVQFLHSPIHAHIHTVHLLAALCCYAQGHLHADLERLGIERPTFRLEDDRSTPQPQPPHHVTCCLEFICIWLTFNWMVIMLKYWG